MRPRDSISDENEVMRQDACVAMEKATDEPWANLIADIVGHPKGAPCVTELAYTNPDLGGALSAGISPFYGRPMSLPG